jgi:hypothetical protein
VRLFVVSVRAATPSKSRDEISVTGEGCDTPSVTVVATVVEQYLTIYFRSLNEIVTSLVRILNIVTFEFQIQTLFFYSNQAIWHLFCNSKSYIQVYPTEFNFVNIMSRRDFGEFIRFL